MTTKPRFAKDGLHFFVIHARPKKGTKVHLSTGGAYVSCWINFRHYEGALELAKFYVKQEGWQVQAIDAHRWINGPKDAERGTLRYYREAQKYGTSLVFHQYPKGSRS